MSENIPHYFPTELSEHDRSILARQAGNHSFIGPMFVGQGLSKRCGSDVYGYYIVASKKVGKKGEKTIWGIARAKQVMHGEWVEGSMDCSIDLSTAQPTCWIIQRGFYHWHGQKTETPKWWFCDEEGRRHRGEAAAFNWNGAHGYRDPSF